ncbi:MAG: hypothetical protein HGA25_06870 [Clostridiales bacterium]|nr:hypothetical protein [Clostridiales bacterium]
MRKKMIIHFLALCLFLANVLFVSAASGTGTVEFKANGTLEMTDADSIEDAFTTMAPGETRTISFTMKNNNGNSANFYVDAQSLQELTAGAESAGAAYVVSLNVVKGTVDTQIYSSLAGGAKDAGSTNNSGLTGIKALGDSVYLTTLAPGESAVMNFSLSLDGVTNNTYQSSEGDFNFLFSVAYDSVAGTTVNRVIVTQGKVIHVVETQENRILGAIRTGDNAAIGIMVLIFISGVTLVVFSVIRKKQEVCDEIANK